MRVEYSIIHMDEFVDTLIREEECFAIMLPRIPKRYVLEEQGVLEPRVSALEIDLQQNPEVEDQVMQDRTAPEPNQPKVIEEAPTTEHDKEKRKDVSNEKNKDQEKKKDEERRHKEMDNRDNREEGRRHKDRRDKERRHESRHNRDDKKRRDRHHRRSRSRSTSKEKHKKPEKGQDNKEQEGKCY